MARHAQHTPPPTREARFTRDGILFALAVGASVYELVWGGARVGAFTFILGLFASPFLLRIEETRRVPSGGSREESDA